MLPCSLYGYQWPDNVTQHKGFIEVDQKSRSFYFYWFFESRNDPSSDPLVVWLTGGPGCSSELALFGENGPFLIIDSAELVYNKYGWNSFANLLNSLRSTDQPIGTGLISMGMYPYYDTKEKEIATTMWNFMLEFYAKYPQYSKLDLYIIGESRLRWSLRACNWEAIFARNSIYTQNLKGIAVGNGWAEPHIQYKAYDQYMYKQGLINETAAAIADGMYDACKVLLDTHVWPVAFYECQLIGMFVLTLYNSGSEAWL